MASLSVQLAIYGCAWLLMGLGYRLNRDVVLLWAAGWFCGSACAGLLFLSDVQPPIGRDLFVNSLAVFAFVFLSWGIDAYVGYQTSHWNFVFAGAGLALLELLRFQGDAPKGVLVGIFTAIASWPLLTAIWRMRRWLSEHRKLSPVLVLLMIAPMVLTIGIFVVRALLVFRGAESQSVDFANSSYFALASTLLFLLLLGAFNFVLASLVLGSLIDRLRELSATDQLTGLANRRVMMRRLDEEHSRYLRGGQLYTVVMIDLDHFKRVNDTHGHGVGDQVLRGLAAVLQSCQRRTDTLARTGGEEFMLLMPMTDMDGALLHACRMCERVASSKLPTDVGELQVTLSLGVAEVLPAEISVDTVVSRADAALYQAKANGRNRVEAAQRSSSPAFA